MIDNVGVLYLAHYAPNEFGVPAYFNAEHAVYAKYHMDIYNILKKNCPHFLSSNDPSVILSPPPGVNYIFSLYNRMPFRNSEVFISAVAEYYKYAYLGARPNIRALAEDKHLAKMMASYVGVPTPRWNVYNIGESTTIPDFDPPYFVKPRFGAASKYIDENSICTNWESAVQRISYLHSHQQDVILEQFVSGIYTTSPVLHNFGSTLSLPCVKQKSTMMGNVVTYQQKRKIIGGLERTVLSNLDLTRTIQAYSLEMFKMVQPLDYTRFDYIIEEQTGKPYFLEFNVCCNLGAHSTLSQAAAQLDIGYEALILNVLFSSMFRQKLTENILYKF